MGAPQLAREPQEQSQELVPDDGRFKVRSHEALDVHREPADVGHRFHEEALARLGDGWPIGQGEKSRVRLRASSRRRQRLARNESQLAMKTLAHAPLLHLPGPHQQHGAGPELVVHEIHHVPGAAFLDEQQVVKVHALRRRHQLGGRAPPELVERECIHAHLREPWVVEANFFELGLGALHRHQSSAAILP